MSDVTYILSEIERGDPNASEQLRPLVHDELRRLAAQKMAVEKPGQTLQATALVHEAYMRLVDVRTAQHWNGRGHFFAAEAMRRILVEYARRKQGPERGGDRVRVALDDALGCVDPEAGEIIAVHEALSEVESESPAAAQLVKLRYFGGMTQREAAECLGILSFDCRPLRGVRQGRPFLLRLRQTKSDRREPAPWTVPTVCEFDVGLNSSNEIVLERPPARRRWRFQAKFFFCLKQIDVPFSHSFMCGNSRE